MHVAARWTSALWKLESVFMILPSWPNPSEQIKFHGRPNTSNQKTSLCSEKAFFWCVFYVPMSSPLRGGDVTVYVFDINQPSLPTPSYSVLSLLSFKKKKKICSCVCFWFMALLTVFHSIHFRENSPLSHSVLPVLFLPQWSSQLCISLWKSPSALI